VAIAAASRLAAMSGFDALRVLEGPDGDDYLRRWMHGRCDTERQPLPVLCPWCEEFDGPSEALTAARERLEQYRAVRE
jgi:exonuclease V gamma subunit